MTFDAPPGSGLCWCYTQTMKPADNRPAQIRQKAADRRSHHKLIAWLFLPGALLGFGAAVLVMERWG